MKTVHPSQLLKLALTVDALVSGAVAVLQLTAAGWLSELLLIPRMLLVETGVFLVAYALILVVLARSPKLWSALVGLVIVGNLGWAAGCALLLASGVLAPSGLGVAFVALHIVAVVAFAGLEYMGLKASAPASRISPARA